MATPRKIHCVVDGIIDHGGHVYTVDLRPECPVPRFRPGQFLHLALDVYDPSGFWPESRVFSIASPPCQRERLRISYSVRGRYTARMERELQKGRGVWVKLPYGEFVVEDTCDVVLFAGGTGITAFAAFLEGLSAEFRHRVYLAYGARKRNLLVYRDMVQRRIQDLPQLHVLYFIEEANDTQPKATSTVSSDEIVGRLSVRSLWDRVQQPLEATYYLSGPPSMLTVLSQDLVRLGVCEENIRIDAWE